MTHEVSETTTMVTMPIPALDGKSIAETVTVEVPCTIDRTTGEEILGPEALETMDRVKARYMGLLLPSEIKKLRTAMGLSQKDMCELLQIGAKSYSRWETGRERPSRSLNLLLRAIWDGKVNPGYLKSIHGPRCDWWALAMRRTASSEKSNAYTVDVSGLKLAANDGMEESDDATKQFAA